MNTEKPIDYLLVGHTSRDILSQGHRLGGTVAYAGLTAHRMGRNVGVITSTDSGEDLSPLSELEVHCRFVEKGTSFQNLYQSDQRNQRLLSRAQNLEFSLIPDEWRQAEIVHLAPIAGEVDLSFFEQFPQAFLVATPQGWLRGWDQEGYIKSLGSEILSDCIGTAEAIVLSDEDLGWDRQAENELAEKCKVVGVTCGEHGARVHANGEIQHFPAPGVEVVDPTGAGDIFAAVFFILLNISGDPFRAAEEANRIATRSVTRTGLESVPTQDELAASMSKV